MNSRGNTTAKLAIVIALLLMLSQTKFCNHPEVSITTDTIVTYDTIFVEKATKPKLIYSQVIDTFKIVDTFEVVRDYQTLKIYADSLKNDTISISIRDTIFKNSILGRNISYTLRLPTRTITNTITEIKEPSGLYFTPYFTPIGNKQGVGGAAVYVRKDWLVIGGYGTSGVHLGVGIKIF